MDNNPSYSVAGNGLGATTRFHDDGNGPDWRRDAVDAALRNRAEDGSPWYLVLAYLQKHLPHFYARKFNESRDRTFAALSARLSLTPVVVPADRADVEERAAPVFGWWSGTFPNSDTPVEVVLAPDGYGDGEWIIASENREQVDTLVREVIADANRHTSRCQIFSGGMWEDAPQMVEEVSRTDWDDIVLSSQLLSDIRQTIDAFFTQKEIFHRLSFAWRRGILLVGPPGTGKTMICRAAAHSHQDVPFLYVRDLDRQRREPLSAIFSHARRQAPCILAFEDMDGLVHRDNRTLFLNELDGFRNNDGLLIIASSNHPERIDEALLKRPSRFDRVYHIGLPELGERAEYCRRLLAKSPLEAGDLNTDRLADQVAQATDGFTPAFLKESLLSAMLSVAQEGRTVLDEHFGKTVLEQVDVLKKYLKKAKNPEVFAEMTASTGPEIGFRAR